MCRSIADGGQRCAAHAEARMLSRLSAYETARDTFTGLPADAPDDARNTARSAMLVAFQRFDDARIEYASTPAGAQDLTNRLKAARDGHLPTLGRAPTGQPIDNPVDLETALRVGSLTRQRNEARRRRNAELRSGRVTATRMRVRRGDTLVVGSDGVSDLDRTVTLPAGVAVRVRAVHNAGQHVLAEPINPGDTHLSGRSALLPVSALVTPGRDRDDAFAAEAATRDPDMSDVTGRDYQGWSASALTDASGI